MKNENNCLTISDEIISKSGQLIVVTASNWNTISADIQLYERDKGNKWMAVSKVFSAVVGKSGLAWGRGQHEFIKETENLKKEGDGKSPAGVFAIGEAFGFSTKSKADWIRLPYVHITQKWECVDDVESQYYNQVIKNDETISNDWLSSEKMLVIGDEYEWGIVVQHNMNPTQPGYGSCIFLHVWKDEKTGTAGCTAMEKANMEMLLRWLDPDKKPLLIQLPQSEANIINQILY